MKMNDEIKKDEPDRLGSNVGEELNVSIVQWQGPRYKIWLKSIAVLVAGVFLFQQIAWAGDIPSLLRDTQKAMGEFERFEEMKQLEEELLEDMQPIEPQEDIPQPDEEGTGEEGTEEGLPEEIEVDIEEEPALPEELIPPQPSEEIEIEEEIPEEIPEETEIEEEIPEEPLEEPEDQPHPLPKKKK
jgi:hypothetical protein